MDRSANAISEYKKMVLLIIVIAIIACAVPPMVAK